MNIEDFPGALRSDAGVCAPAGFSASGAHVGFRRDPHRLDMACVVADEVVPTAAVFTQNVFCAPPVTVSKEHLDGCGYGMAKAVVINSGIANAATGTVGIINARKSAQAAADVLGCTRTEVLVASTGVIGQQLDMSIYESGVKTLAAKLAPTNSAAHDAACAIMTTDTRPKEVAITFESEDPDFKGTSISFGGMVKGSGMIMPNMATMIAVITTDAPLSAPVAHSMLSGVVADSFNRVTVDSDTSTNDCCFLMASGQAALGKTITPGSVIFDECTAALRAVCVYLARAIAADGEGATKLVTVNVTGAQNAHEADACARAIANSPLVKTAIFGHDANWGRIAAAAGKSGAHFSQENVDIDIMGIPVCRAGLNVEFSEEEALKRFENDEIILDIDLGAGEASAQIWTCDFSHEYVSINGDYRS